MSHKVTGIAESRGEPGPSIVWLAVCLLDDSELCSAIEWSACLLPALLTPSNRVDNFKPRPGTEQMHTKPSRPPLHKQSTPMPPLQSLGVHQNGQAAGFTAAVSGSLAILQRDEVNNSAMAGHALGGANKQPQGPSVSPRHNVAPNPIVRYHRTNLADQQCA